MFVFQIMLGVIVKLKHKEKKEKISKIRNTKASLKNVCTKKNSVKIFNCRFTYQAIKIDR